MRQVYQFPHSPPGRGDGRGRLRRNSVILNLILAAFLLGLSWAALSELDQVVSAEAKIIPFQKLQTVQHFEGGIVDKIYVSAGDRVRAGDPLLSLDAVEASGGYQSKKSEVLALSARVKRLEAEANNTALTFSARLEREIPAVLATERELLASHRQQLESTVGALTNQQQQRRSELEAARKQLSLVVEEKRTIDQLVELGLEPKLESVRFEKSLLEAEHRVRSAQDAIQELEHRMAAVRQESRASALSELSKVLAELSQSEKSLPVVAGKVDRTIVRSPSEGVVNRVLVTTVGGILRSGEPAIEIVPSQSKLTFDARIAPADIGFVKVGQTAQVKMTTYDFSVFGSLRGVVDFIGADTVSNERGETFYTVRIDLVDARFNAANRELKLLPGMTAQIDIITGKRSVLSYLSAPVTRTLTSAFTEK